MKVFWIPVIATLIIWAVGGGFYWEIREGSHYQLSDSERVNAYITLFGVASALTGSIFLIFQHWLARIQLAQTNMPRLYLAVIHSWLNNNPNSHHRTAIFYKNLTDNDFEDLKISLYGSIDKNEPNKLIKTCIKKGYVQGRDERYINTFTQDIFSELGTNNNKAMSNNSEIRIQVKHEYSYLRNKIMRLSSVYIFNFSSMTWDIDE